eukprot:CAMPEP_0178429762 /NCGR_PEP_ID=MMETSP0689_2-20121128/30972_1 /TAXON_ID=160604 /ORGANISM="Amphidinium massartii, Strain CS-259" /LENGTH=60 /DNA_ID=CAMNT_0020051599 /DNA_START=302 /DNA_END=484 /DNA_ORIENTATION=-
MPPTPPEELGICFIRPKKEEPASSAGKAAKVGQDANQDAPTEAHELMRVLTHKEPSKKAT